MEMYFWYIQLHLIIDICSFFYRRNFWSQFSIGIFMHRRGWSSVFAFGAFFSERTLSSLSPLDLFDLCMLENRNNSNQSFFLRHEKNKCISSILNSYKITFSFLLFSFSLSWVCDFCHANSEENMWNPSMSFKLYF